MMSIISDKKVCFKCAGKSLGKYIKSLATENSCSYCHKQNDSMPIYDLKAKIIQSWQIFYEIVEDSFSYDPRTKYGSYDMIFTNDDTELEDANDDFKNDLGTVLADYCWIRRSDYWEELPNSLVFDWEQFCNLVKTKWRYTFFLSDSFIENNPMKILSSISQFIKNLVISFPRGKEFYRCRGFETVPKTVLAKDLGSAPLNKAKENRFSPCGISLFYASLEKDTAKAEVEIKVDETLVMGKFRNPKSIQLLDLTNIPTIPCLYDEDNENIPALQFLHNFSNAISKTVNSKSDYDRLDYIPTQIFTEYIRRIGLKDFGIKGIKYKSSKRKNGKNLVFFYTNDDCIDESELLPDKDCLVLKSWAVYSKQQQEQSQ